MCASVRVYVCVISVIVGQKLFQCTSCQFCCWLISWWPFDSLLCCFSYFYAVGYVLQLEKLHIKQYLIVIFSATGNLGCLPQAKPAAVELHYITLIWPASVQAHTGIWKCPQVSKPWADSGCQLWVYRTIVIDFLPHHLSALSVWVSWGLSSCAGWPDQWHTPASLLASCLYAGHNFLIELTFDICLRLAGEGTWQPTWFSPPPPQPPLPLPFFSWL